MAMPTHIVAVGGFVENEQGHILLVKTQHGGWVFPGGQVEIGENLLDALIREIKEESGIDIVVSHVVGIYSNTGIHKWHDGITDVPTKLMMDFVCKPVGGTLGTSEGYYLRLLKSLRRLFCCFKGFLVVGVEVLSIQNLRRERGQ